MARKKRAKIILRVERAEKTLGALYDRYAADALQAYWYERL